MNKKLFDSINKALTNFSLKELKSLSLQLSQKYKQKKHKYFSSDKERLAYIVSRMPATFAALKNVLKEIKINFPDLEIKSVLDLGSGPATAAWAMFSVFENINQMRLVEKDSILNLGKNLIKDENYFDKLIFDQTDILKIKNFDYDLVCLSYVTTEIKKPFIDKIIKRWFYSNSKIIVFLEPGTMYGFKNIKYIRQNLIKLGSRIIAPCPNDLKCPMPENDWCHFFVRLQRSKQHKYLKEGSLAYEDEKFSYVIATKLNFDCKYSRVLRRPIIKKDDISLVLCSKGEITKEIISRKDRKRYKISQKARWGDRFDVERFDGCINNSI
jgi:ribosomal protein RSM22 (predicted rRNA methylase)